MIFGGLLPSSLPNKASVLTLSPSHDIWEYGIRGAQEHDELYIPIWEGWGERVGSRDGVLWGVGGQLSEVDIEGDEEEEEGLGVVRYGPPKPVMNTR